MKLIGNIVYEVTLRMPSGRNWTVPLCYCGGSMVDDEGHFISGGVWNRPHPKHPNDAGYDVSLHDPIIIHIKRIPVKDDPKSEGPGYWDFWKREKKDAK